MSYNSKYTGQQVEDLLDQVASGNAGEGGGSSGGTAEKEIVSITNGVIEALEPNKIYILENNNAYFEIQSIVEPDGDYAEYTVIIVAVSNVGGDEEYSPSLTLPSGLRWVNGETLYIAESGCYELSIVYWFGDSDSGYNAVLSKFK